jgi:hypothetical protein
MHFASCTRLPIKRRQGVPTTYAVPIKRRKPRIDRLPAPTDKVQVEPTLDLEEYENILDIMRNMVLVVGRSPKTFEQMGEEDLRTHFLVQLNAQYEGQATGETFNSEGKTDILIRQENKNIFIAECKFWDGEKKYLETIDQLLSYAGWRDTKTAILLFSRNVGFSGVLQSVAASTPTHPCFVRDLGKKNETEFRYIFRRPTDPTRELFLSVLVFDIPKPAKVK